jgi:hypothetical protein
MDFVMSPTRIVARFLVWGIESMPLQDWFVAPKYSVLLGIRLVKADEIGCGILLLQDILSQKYVEWKKKCIFANYL